MLGIVVNALDNVLSTFLINKESSCISKRGKDVKQGKIYSYLFFFSGKKIHFSFHLTILVSDSLFYWLAYQFSLSSFLSVIIFSTVFFFIYFAEKFKNCSLVLATV